MSSMESAELEMAAEAEKVCEYLFSADSGNLWTVLYPTSRRIRGSEVIKAPSAHTFDTLPLQDRKLEAEKLLLLITQTIGHFREAARSLFTRSSSSPSSPSQITSTLRNTSFWTMFFRTLVVELSGGLLDRPDHTRTEAEICHQLITPTSTSYSS